MTDRLNAYDGEELFGILDKAADQVESQAKETSSKDSEDASGDEENLG